MKSEQIYYLYLNYYLNLLILYFFIISYNKIIYMINLTENNFIDRVFLSFTIEN